MQSHQRMFSRSTAILAALILAALGVAAAIGGCGGGGGGVTIVPGSPATPANVVVVSDAANSRVVVKWNISGGATNYKIFRTPPLPAAPALAKPHIAATGGGLIGSSSQAEYDDTAVQDGTAYTYQVAASNSSGDSAESEGVSVTYRAAPSITINPAIPSLLPGGTATFTATIAGISGANANAVTWSVQEGAPGGTITQNGVYTAPASVGTYHVVAVSQADPTKQAVATVLVGTSNGSTTVTVQ